MKYKLLIAEDEPIERDALSKTLNTHLGEYITIHAAGSGSDAVELFHRESPEIAILNIEMPDISGLDVAKTIRESGKLCAILFTTDQDRFSYAKQAIALRALDYIPKPYDREKLILSVQEAIQNLGRWGTILPDAHPEPEETPEDTRLAIVREDISAYIDAHYMEELSMKNVAHAMNYSDAYFCKLFKQCFHVNFSTYLNEYRIGKAKEMMRNPRITIKEISISCGYTDSNYFARVFKRITSRTPTEYRLSVMDRHLT